MLVKPKVFHKPTQTIQIVAQIDWNNSVINTYGIDEPIYNIPFDDVDFLPEHKGHLLLTHFLANEIEEAKKMAEFYNKRHEYHNEQYHHGRKHAMQDVLAELKAMVGVHFL